MSNVLGITYTDVMREIKGATLEDFDSVQGEGDAVTLLNNEIDRVVSMIKSKLPKKYRELITKCIGEVLTADAVSGTTEYTLSLSDASSVKLYKNYNSPWKKSDSEELYDDEDFRNYPKRWSDRTTDDQMESSEYSVSGQTVTLISALSEHDTLYAEYTHNLSSPPEILKQLALSIARFACVRKYLFAFNNELPESYRQEHDEAKDMLNDILNGDLGIDDFDEIEMVDDWVRARGQLTTGVIERG